MCLRDIIAQLLSTIKHIGIGIVYQLPHLESFLMMAINFTLSQGNECELLLITASQRQMHTKVSKVGKTRVGLREIFYFLCCKIVFDLLLINNIDFINICKLPLL